MGKKSKVNQTLERDRIAAQQQQNQIFQQLSQPTPEQARWREQSANWDNFIKSKNYANAPQDSILNFDLYAPSYKAQQRERLSNLTGVGASSLAGQGDNSIAIQQSKERNANQSAEDAGASYENAIKQSDAYFKNSALPYASLDINKNLGLLSNATNREMEYTNQWVATRPRSWLPQILGGVLQAGAAVFGGGAGAGFSGLFSGATQPSAKARILQHDGGGSPPSHF